MLTYELEELQEKIPAAFAHEPAEHVSNKYQFVRTADILQRFYDAGWVANSALQARTRKSNPLTSKHEVSLVPRDAQSQHMELGGLFAQLTLRNSHDWTSLFEGQAGLFRKVCNNGMTVHEAGESIRVRHDRIDESVQEMIESLSAFSEKQFEQAFAMNARQLEEDELSYFLSNAALLRFGEKATEDHAKALNRKRRYDDAPNTLWAAFNRIQENGMQGTWKVGSMKRKVRALTNIDARRDWNTDLRDLALTFMN